MGTDLYLHYDGMDHDEWRDGYIRASIGQINENWLLRQVFAPTIWEHEDPKCPDCEGGYVNFKKQKTYAWNDKHRKCKSCQGEGSKDGVRGARFHYTKEAYERMLRYATQYMYGEQRGEKLASAEEAGVDHGQKVAKMLSKMGFDKIVSAGQAGNPIDRVMYGLDWLGSVLEHFHLGMKLEKEGKNPRVYISW